MNDTLPSDGHLRMIHIDTNSFTFATYCTTPNDLLRFFSTPVVVLIESHGVRNLKK